MKKRLIVLAVFTMLVSFLNAQISKITSFSNETFYRDFDEYSNSVYKYGDRLIVQCAYKIEEYNILNNGELDRIGFTETKRTITAYINEDR